MTMPIPLSAVRVHRLPATLAFGATDIGPVRAGNEDNFLVDEALGLAMVADGMGGHAAGEVASAGALTTLRDYLHQRAADLPAPSAVAGMAADPDATWSDPAAGAVRLLHAGIAHANASLYAQNCSRNRSEGGMGTTLTGFWRPYSAWPLVFFHVGDSRLYRLRGGVLEQLTRDQTMYQQALEAGMFDNLPARNLLLQAVGPSASVMPEVRSHLALDGDVLMLCSDGLHGSVPHAEMESMLARATPGNLDQLCAQLIDMAKLYGARDNITVLLALCASDAA
ncbi:protein phosphatase 2C domain-containing protein [Massilia sp. PAMC28688]|uniref:PP2C family protein-serine/threonine phosphatase n=1 Tax=Massilia sp. PAMC28688 TaxID=2861283 RepID=UPI001C626DAA|nr:protein phosphatase 2C domain-containing protein [Massilia sp. PAMC28688]QYF95741.1 protein phosphatase 2C domain-containing protein [Massilia sp. PAMC28688]